MLQVKIYSRFSTPPPIFIVATVFVFVWDIFCILSVTALDDAVVKVCPAASVVLAISGVYTDHVTEEMVAVSRKRDQSIL